MHPDILASCVAKPSVAIAFTIYDKAPKIRRILVGDKIVDHSEVVGAPSVGTAPPISSLLT